MVGAVDPEDARNLHLCRALRRNITDDLLGNECDLRESVAFDNFFVHLLVATSAAAITARGVDNQRAARNPRCAVEMHLALFQRECPAYRVKRITERESDLRLSRRKADNRLLRKRGLCKQNAEDNEQRDPRRTLAVKNFCQQISPEGYAVNRCHPSEAALRAPKERGGIAPVCTANILSNRAGLAVSALKTRLRKRGRPSIASITSAMKCGS